MKKLLITLLLISPFSFADWGDVYYCQMTSYSEVSLEGIEKDWELEKFTFKLDKTKNAMVFGKGGSFSNFETEMEAGSFPSIERWFASKTVSKLYFKDGKLLFTILSDEFASYVSADCDKF